MSDDDYMRPARGCLGALVVAGAFWAGVALVLILFL